MDFKNTNSAVIKSMFMQMKKNVFVQNVKLLKAEYLQLVPNFYNQNYERKLWELYKFSAFWYWNYWQSKK